MCTRLMQEMGEVLHHLKNQMFNRINDFTSWVYDFELAVKKLQNNNARNKFQKFSYGFPQVRGLISYIHVFFLKSSVHLCLGFFVISA